VSELRRIEAEERTYVPPFGLIWAYAGLGEKDEAFAILEKSFEERRDRMVWLNMDPLLDPLRSDALQRSGASHRLADVQAVSGAKPAHWTAQRELINPAPLGAS
jgi:hypothetical protein